MPKMPNAVLAGAGDHVRTSKSVLHHAVRKVTVARKDVVSLRGLALPERVGASRRARIGRAAASLW